MVSVRGQYCIDRFEASLVDSKLSRPLSPFYHPTQSQTRTTFQLWESLRFTMGEPQYQILPIPAPPSFQLTEAFSVKAVSVRDTVPAGYLNGYLAEEACKNAGKRLCNEEEWVVACRGERNLNFPYGDQFEPDRCNVNNGRHPARILHGHAGKGHLDPRLNAFAYDGQPLLHATGRSPDCVSRWGDDGAWDMVGNIDEWVDDADGTFVGGFYARNTQAGCAARITVHPRAYFDYSLGVRCCR
jgi:formylglycine-generating enzyme required for sulfatase activity